MTLTKLTIGSRGSKLALVQSNWVKSELERIYPELKVEIKIIQTQGDKILDVALSKIGDKGLFVKELENELLVGTIDLAVHSAKDLETKLPSDLEIACFTKREDIRDVLCFAKHKNIKTLEEAKVIGTSSLRRVAQLKAKYPHLDFIDIRGNVDTRFKKLDDPNNDYDGIVLAAAGINRLAPSVNDFRDRISIYLEPDEILPAVGQGALAIEIASKRSEIKDLLTKLNSRADELVVKGERAFLRKLEGGCQVPVGIYSEPEGTQVKFTGLVASLDGSQIIKDEICGELDDSETLAESLAQKLLDQGAKDIWLSISG